MNLSEAKDFPVSTASLKEVRVFSRDVFEKINLPQEQKDELVLAIAEAAQNIVKHGYKGVEKTTDRIIGCSCYYWYFSSSRYSCISRLYNWSKKEFN